MKRTNAERKKYEKIDYREHAPDTGEYEYCLFSNCNFSECDLSGIYFSDCEFLNCNLSLVTLTKTTLRDVQFNGCKMLGVHFEHCNQFGFAVGFDRSTRQS